MSKKLTRTVRVPCHLRFAARFPTLIATGSDRKTTSPNTWASGVSRASQTAKLVLEMIRAAETGGASLMLARIGVLKALHRDRERVFDPGRKETHWGKRKLKRDL
jgi:hypothetical protein